MLTVLLNLLVTLIGFGAGYLFFVRNRQTVVSLLRNARLVIDYDYFVAIYRLLAHDNNYHQLSLAYGLPEPYEHQKIMYGSEVATYRLLRTAQIDQLKRLAGQIALVASAPLLVGLIMDKPLLIAASILLTVAFVALFEVLKDFGTKQTVSHRKLTVLEHAYATGGRQLGNPAPTPWQQPSQTIAASQADLFAAFPNLAMPASSTAYIPEATAAEPPMPLPAFPASRKRRRSLSLKNLHKISWPTLWWGTDIAVTSLLVANYWWSNAMSDGIAYFILLTMALIGFVQLFFVPMWFTIKVCIRLIESEHAHSGTIHQK